MSISTGEDSGPDVEVLVVEVKVMNLMCERSGPHCSITDHRKNWFFSLSNLVRMLLEELETLSFSI